MEEQDDTKVDDFNIYNVIHRSLYSDREFEHYILNPIICKKSIWNPLGR